jgi:hypothetical protein
MPRAITLKESVPVMGCVLARRLAASERELLLRAGRGEALSEADRCRMVRAIFHGYNLIPLHDRARVLRRNVM